MRIYPDVRATDPGILETEGVIELNKKLFFINEKRKDIRIVHIETLKKFNLNFDRDKMMLSKYYKI